MTTDKEKAQQHKLLSAKARAYRRGKDGRGIKWNDAQGKVHYQGKLTGSGVCQTEGVNRELLPGILGKQGIYNRTLFTGTEDADTDNLTVLQKINSESVDLIYLDPPFNSNRNYAAPITSAAGKVGAFFEDTWANDKRWGIMQAEIKNRCFGAHAALLAAFHSISGGMPQDTEKRRKTAREAGESAKSYLTFMALRLLELKRVLKDTGSIYLHCDPTMSHYLKMLMDAIFGTDNFRNEIVWCYKGQSMAKAHLPRKHDSILFYAKSASAKFARPYTPRAEEEINAKYTRHDAKGRYFITHRKVYEWEDRGTPINNWWADIPSFQSATGSKERTGYPTQKPLALLERIIKASSNPGDIVLDPFCGCGTALCAADRLDRKWIGIDATCAAGVVLIEDRIRTKMDGGLDEIAPLTHWRMIADDSDLPARTDDGAVSTNPKTHEFDPPEQKQPRVRKAEKDAFLRAAYEEQNGECNGCGDKHECVKNWHLDRIIPGSEGGKYEDGNVQGLCGNCNTTKSNGAMPDLWRRLATKGHRVSQLGTTFFAAPQMLPDRWKRILLEDELAVGDNGTEE